MTEQTALVPIAPARRNEWIEGLIQSKREAASQALAGRSVAELEPFKHWYVDANQHQFLLRLNLVILHFGQPNGQDRIIWNCQAGTLKIVAAYHNANGVTEVRVNDSQVCWNGSAHERYLNPGNWMYPVEVHYEALEREAKQRAEDKDWSMEMGERVKQQKLILDLTAEV